MLILADDLARPGPYPHQAEILRVKRRVQIDDEVLWITGGHMIEKPRKRIGPVTRGANGTEAVPHSAWTEGSLKHVLTESIGPTGATIRFQHVYQYDDEQMQEITRLWSHVERGADGSDAASHSAGAEVIW